MCGRIKTMVAAVLWVFSMGCLDCLKEQEHVISERTEFCRINGETMYFLTDDEKEKLRDPLINLLSNETCAIYADTVKGEIIGYEPYDPNLPTVPEGHGCGLYDVTGDGMPELLVHPKGYYGSSGTITYFVYDIFTGRMLGSIDGGNAESLCVYYFKDTDELCSVGSYWRRGGWSERYRVMMFLSYDDEYDVCFEESFLYAHLGIDGEFVKTEEIDSGGNYVEKWVETYSYARYSVYGEDATLDAYYGELDWFYMNSIRIPETELQIVKWWDITSDVDDRFDRAERMAEALLSSTQKFLVPRSA